MGTHRTQTKTPAADPFGPAIAANVRAELARAGMSRDGLAKRTGLTTTQLNRRLRGEANITAAEVLRLAQALGVPATALLNTPLLPEDVTTR